MLRAPRHSEMVQVVVQDEHQHFYTTHFDLHYTTKFWVHHPHHPTVSKLYPVGWS